MEKTIYIEECKEGDILSRDIYDERGALFVNKNTILNNYIIVKLKNIGMKKVKIYNYLSYNNYDKKRIDDFSIIYKECILVLKHTLNDIASGKKINGGEIKSISEQIYKEIEKDSYTIRYIQMMKDKDEYTYHHSISVAIYSILIGKWLKLSKDELLDLSITGVLHDIGKLRIPDYILNKKGPLTDEEYEKVKEHSCIGYEMLKELPEINDKIKNAVLMHHERIDRSGYPFGVSEDEISLYSKIIAVADVYDAITSDRTYKKRKTPFEAVQEFKDVEYNKLDLEIFMTFINNILIYYTGSKVKLNNGDIGEIVYIPPQNMIKPVIRVTNDYIDLSKDNDIKILELVG